MTDHRAPAVRRAAAAAFVLYLVVLAGAAFLPLPVGQVGRGTGPRTTSRCDDPTCWAGGRRSATSS